MLVGAPALSIDNAPVVSIAIPPVPALISTPPAPVSAVSLMASATSSVEVIFTDEPVATISISSPAAAPLAKISIPPAVALICNASAAVPAELRTGLRKRRRP